SSAATKATSSPAPRPAHGSGGGSDAEIAAGGTTGSLFAPAGRADERHAGTMASARSKSRCPVVMGSSPPETTHGLGGRESNRRQTSGSVFSLRKRTHPRLSGSPAFSTSLGTPTPS